MPFADNGKLVSEWVDSLDIEGRTLDEVMEELTQLKTEHGNSGKYSEFRFRIEGNEEDGYSVDLMGYREPTDEEKKRYEQHIAAKERAELARLKAKYPD